MSSESHEQTLKALCLLIVDCPHATPEWTDSGFVVLRNQNIKNGRLDLSNPSYTDEAHYSGRTRRATPTSGDIVITREAPMGEVCLIPKGLMCCLGQRQVLLRPNTSKVDSKFLLYALQSPYLQHQIGWNEGTGSTVSNLRIPVLESLSVPTPPLGDQHQIAQTLGVLDDRITLLRETNKTLESIAQTIFKSWFVDFDPVRARMEGRRPDGMDEETAALFPDSFEESELGLIPRGWAIQPFLSSVEVLGGGTPKTKVAEYWDGSIPWFSVIDAPVQEDVWVVNTEKHITQKGLEESSTRLLPEGTTIISARGTVGRLALTGCSMAMNQSCYGLRGKSGDVYFTYFSTRRLTDVLRQHAHGSVFDTITRETLKSVSIVQPTSDIIKAFENSVRAVMERVKTNVRCAKGLAVVRDTLLPRLISGQLRLTKPDVLVTESAI